MNGQMSRSGSKHKAWFEGGQMPLQRRIPKFGFTNIFRVEFQVVNISSLEKHAEKFGSDVVTIEVLKKNGLVSSSKRPVKILGQGDLKAKLQIEVNAFSNSAKEKIEKAGGSIKQI